MALHWSSDLETENDFHFWKVTYEDSVNLVSNRRLQNTNLENCLINLVGKIAVLYGRVIYLTGADSLLFISPLDWKADT